MEPVSSACLEQGRRSSRRSWTHAGLSIVRACGTFTNFIKPQRDHRKQGSRYSVHHSWGYGSPCARMFPLRVDRTVHLVTCFGNVIAMLSQIIKSNYYLQAFQFYGCLIVNSTNHTCVKVYKACFLLTSSGLCTHFTRIRWCCREMWKYSILKESFFLNIHIWFD